MNNTPDLPLEKLREEVEHLRAIVKQQESTIAMMSEKLNLAVSELYSLIDACAQLNSTLELKKLLAYIMKMAAKITKAEASSLALVDEATGELMFEVATGEKGDIIKEIRLKKGEGIIGWTIEHDQELLIEDVQQDPRFYRKADEKSSFKTSSILCVPLRTKEGCIGGVEVLNKIGGRFTENDTRLLMALANQSAIAIENARLYERIMAEKAKIESIVSCMSDGIIVTDQKNQITMMNPAARSLFSRTDVDSSKLSIILDEVSQLKDNSQFDIVLMKPENIILSNRMAVLKDQNGEFAGTIISLRNISAAKKVESERSQFLSIIAHNLQEPAEKLKNILKELENLKEKLDETLLKSLEELENASGAVNEYAMKLLYFSEIEAGPLRISRQKTSLPEIAAKVIQEYKNVAARKEISLSLKYDESIREIDIDRQRIEEAISRLVSNGIKFTPSRGSVNISISDTMDFVEVSVSDTGIGIPPALVEKLFDKEKHREGFLVGQTEEVLGLAFVQHIIEAHGGTISVSSTIGEGTTFTFKLPKYIH